VETVGVSRPSFAVDGVDQPGPRVVVPDVHPPAPFADPPPGRFEGYHTGGFDRRIINFPDETRAPSVAVIVDPDTFDGSVPRSFHGDGYAPNLRSVNGIIEWTVTGCIYPVTSPTPIMGHHTFDPARADRLNDPSRYQYLSVDELVALVDPSPDDVLADLGSGTGFYTDDIARYAGTVEAVDLQSEMHRLYRERGIPENVTPITSGIEDLPFRDGTLDGAFSTMTFHEFAGRRALAELGRVLAAGAALTIADWTAEGEGRGGPPLAERFSASEASERVRAAGFAVDRAEDRRDTFVLRALRADTMS